MQLVKSVGKFILNRGFGIMTERQVLATALKTGRAVGEKAASGSILTSEVLEKIFKSHTPKGIKIPPVVADKEVAKSILKKGVPADFKRNIDETFGCAAGTYGNVFGNEVLYIPSSEWMVNVASHEYTHALQAKKFKDKFAHIVVKLLPKKLLMKLAKKGKVSSNMSQYINFERSISENLGSIMPTATVIGKATKKGLCEYMGCSQETFSEYLQKLVRSKLSDNPKGNIRMLESLLDDIAKDTEAYMVGAKASRMAKPLEKGVVHSSEMISAFHKELECAIKEEITLQKSYVAQKKLSKTFVMPQYEKEVKSPSKLYPATDAEDALSEILTKAVNALDLNDPNVQVSLNLSEYFAKHKKKIVA